MAGVLSAALPASQVLQQLEETYYPQYCHSDEVGLHSILPHPQLKPNPREMNMGFLLPTTLYALVSMPGFLCLASYVFYTLVPMPVFPMPGFLCLGSYVFYTLVPMPVFRMPGFLCLGSYALTPVP